MSRLVTMSGRQTLACMLFVSVLATAVLCQQFDGLRLTNDAAQACSVTGNLLNGHGFSTGIIFYEEHYLTGSWPAAQTVFPPGFPALTALLTMFGMSVETAAFAINAAGFFVIPILICGIGLKIGLNGLTSLLTGIAWLCFPTNWRNACECQTEMMFLLFTLGSVLLMENGTHRFRYFLLSGLCSAAAFSMRYAGIFWLVTAGVVLGTAVLLRRAGSLRTSIVFFFCPAIIVGLLFIRNHQLVGDLKGGNNNQINKPVATALMSAYYALSGLTGYDQDGLRSGRPQEVVTVLGGLLLLTSLVSFLFRTGLRKLLVSLRHNASAFLLTDTRRLMIWLYIPATVAALMWLEKRTSITLSARMFLPLIPFVLLAAADGLRRLPAGLRAQYLTGLPGLVLVLLGIGLAQWQVAADLNEKPSTLAYVQNALDNSPASTEKTSSKRTTAELTPREQLTGQKILTNEPHMLGHALHQNVVGLTTHAYTSRTWSVPNVARLMQQYQLTHVALFPELHTAEPNPFFHQLRKDPNSVPWLEVIASGENLLICRTRSTGIPLNSQESLTGTFR